MNARRYYTAVASAVMTADIGLKVSDNSREIKPDTLLVLYDDGTIHWFGGRGSVRPPTKEQFEADAARMGREIEDDA